MRAIHHFDLSKGITQEEIDRKYDIQEKDPEGREQVDFEWPGKSYIFRRRIRKYTISLRIEWKNMACKHL